MKTDLKAGYIATPSNQRVPAPPPPENFVPNLTTLHQATLFRLRSQHCKVNSSNISTGIPSSVTSRGAARTPGKRLRRKAKHGTKDGTDQDSKSEHDVAAESESDGRSTQFSIATELPENYNYDDSGNESEQQNSYDPFEDFTFEMKTYHHACALLDQAPIKGVLQGLGTEEIRCRFRLMGANGARALAEVMRENITVEKLELVGNDIGADGAMHMCAMLQVNVYITHLTLADNNLRSEGLYHISHLLRGNSCIQYLDISGNNFKDDDAVLVTDMLQVNEYLTELNLSMNTFSEKGGTLLAPGISQNTTLKRLDLSWNHLRRRGAVAVIEAMKTNTGLAYLNIAWNGFHLDGCKAVRSMLVKNTTLQELNLSCNRVDKECLNELIKGLCKNSTLQKLELLQNPLTSEGALYLVESILKVPSVTIGEIDISGQMVNDAFQKKRDTLMRTRNINIKHGQIMAAEAKVVKPDDGMVFLNDNPMVVLMEYMRITNLRLVDLFTSLDKDGSWSLSRDEFKEGLMGANIPLSMEAIDNLVTKLDTDGDGEVDFGELISGAKAHKSQVLRYTVDNPEVPFEETDVGRVNIKLQAIMTYRQMMARIQNEKSNNGTSEQLTETMDELRQQLSVAHTGQESLQLVKRAQAKFRAIMSFKSLLKVAKAKDAKGKDSKFKAAVERKKSGAKSGRPLGGMTTPLLKGAMSRALKSSKGKR